MTKRRGQQLAWGTYDLANTIFSMNVISLYLPLWVASSFRRGDVWFAAAYSLSMAVTGIVSPLVGALGMKVGHKRILLFTTIAAVGFTALLGSYAALPVILMLFVIANCAYQLSLVAYNSLLPSVAEPHERGRVSGLGVALGYFGSFVGMLSVLPLIDPAHFARLPHAIAAFVRPLLKAVPEVPGVIVRQNAFLPTAILFALFALPLFFMVREKKYAAPKASSAGEAWRTFREIRRDRNLLRFFIGTFLYMDAVHTTYIVMGTYGKMAVGLGDGEIVKVMSIAIISAVLGSFAYGFIADRLSKKTAVLTVIANWIVALSIAIVSRDATTYLVVAVVAGAGMGGVEVVGRVALLSLIPEEESGRYFGLFSFVGKASSIVGPQLWALTLLLFEPLGSARYRIAVGLLCAMTVAAAVTIWSVRFGNLRERVNLSSEP